MMSKLREFSFPIVMLSAWVVVAAYTVSSLGETHVRVQTALAAQRAPAVETNVAVPAAPALTAKAHKKLNHRGPRV
jgi:hypothetical protein